MNDRETKARVYFETIRHLLDPGLIARFTYDGCVVHLGIVRTLVDRALEELGAPSPSPLTKLHLVEDAQMDNPTMTLCRLPIAVLRETEGFEAIVALSRRKAFKNVCGDCLMKVDV